MEKTLKEARREMIDNLRTGSNCQCCGRFAKLWATPISGAMVKGLAWIANANTVDGWVSVQESGPDWMKRSNSHAKLINWGLLSRKEGDDPTKRHSGVYRATAKGISFLAGELSVRKYAMIYNKKCFALEGKKVFAEDVVGERFDFRKIMEAA